MTGKKPRIFATHFGPHLSDLFALYLLSRFGPHDERGFKVAFIKDRSKFHDKGVVMETMGNENVVFIGMGGGKYDEHAKGMIDCEATLVAKDLGILRDIPYNEKIDPHDKHVFSVSHDGQRKFFYSEEEKLTTLFAAVLRDDLGGSQSFGLGTLIKISHNAHPQMPAVAMQWAFDFFDVVLDIGPILKEMRAGAMMNAATAIASSVCAEAELGGFSCISRKRITEWLSKYLTGEAQWQPYNLVDCVAILMTAKHDFAQWLGEVVRSELEEQEHFHQKSSIEATKSRFHDVEILIRENGSERTEARTVAVIESDDPHVHKYLLSAEFGYHAAAVVKKDSSGRVMIFPGTYFREKKYIPLSFLMPGITAMIRAKECKARGMNVPRWPVLLSEGGPDKEKTWHFQPASGILMNGSLTAEVAPTVLPLVEIVDAVLIGMDNVRMGERMDKFESLKKVVNNQFFVNIK